MYRHGDYISVQQNNGFLPDIMLLTRCYYPPSTRCLLHIHTRLCVCVCVCVCVLYNIYLLPFFLPLIWCVPAWRLYKCTAEQRVSARYYAVDPMLLPLVDPIISHQEFLSLQLMFLLILTPKRFSNPPPPPVIG